MDSCYWISLGSSQSRVPDYLMPGVYASTRGRAQWYRGSQLVQLRLMWDDKKNVLLWTLQLAPTDISKSRDRHMSARRHNEARVDLATPCGELIEGKNILAMHEAGTSGWTSCRSKAQINSTPIHSWLVTPLAVILFRGSQIVYEGCLGNAAHASATSLAAIWTHYRLVSFPLHARLLGSLIVQFDRPY